MSQTYSTLLTIFLFLSFLTLSTPINHTNQPKTYIIRIQNELKPPNITSIQKWYKSILGNINSNNEFLHVYNTAFHGFTMQLTPQQIDSIKTRPEVIGIYPDEILELHTTRSPHFLGLNSYNNPTGLLNESQSGSNVVIGVFDTGIWPMSPSFNDDGFDPVPSRFKGECAGGQDFPKSLCNKKIIGVRYFSSGFRSIDGVNNAGMFNTVLDQNGHGTHTASTMAGRTLKNASFFNFAKGVATGIAPKARLAIYKVCWARGCVTSDVLAAFDKAIEDGVDVISMSLGGPVRRYSDDPISIATFAAADKGVFVSASAGNEGPSLGVVSNIAPWVTTVGASTIDRSFPAVLKLSNGDSFMGASIYTGNNLPKEEIFPIVYFNSSWAESHCVPGSLNEKNLTGKIVVCLPQILSEAEKSIVVKKAGGAGVIVTNDATWVTETLTSRPFIIPGLLLPFSASQKLLDYLNKAQINATIIIQGTEIGTNLAPIVADFSSRGPNQKSIYVLKPDVTAPGVDILAAWPNYISPSGSSDDPRRSNFNIISGTSMSCPHVSGIAALLKGSHPDWSPAMIRSALMTTAYKGYKGVLDMSSEQLYEANESPWDIGAGHVNPDQANDPGLVYNITTGDYINFLCASNYSESEVKVIAKKAVKCENVSSKPWDVNYPAIVVSSSQVSVVNRTLTNVGSDGVSYEVKVVEPKDFNVTVEPLKLRFESKGSKQGYSVKVSPLKNETTQHVQNVGLVIWSDGKHNVTIPLIVYSGPF